MIAGLHSQDSVYHTVSTHHPVHVGGGCMRIIEIACKAVCSVHATILYMSGVAA